MTSSFGLVKEINIEVADTPELRQKGLMWRERLGPDNGMLFDFEKPMKLVFWGKNTMIPLDIAFLDDKMRIINTDRISPMSMNSIMSPKPCRYALEMPKGFFKKNAIGKGHQCRMRGDRMGIYHPEVVFDV